MVCFVLRNLDRERGLTFLQKQQQQAAANAEGGGQRKKKVTAAQLRVQKGEAFAPFKRGKKLALT